MVSPAKPPVDLSVAVRKHHDPTVESQVCVICPRRKGKPTEKRSGTSPVALSLDFLRPLFKKPLTQVSEELGLSATAIKKACRRFGVPKWPFRTLTAKTSRNRASFEGPPSAPQVHVSFPHQGMPKFQHGMPAPDSADGLRQNPLMMGEDMKKLQEDAEMMKEVAALAAAREVDKKGDSVADQELAAARNLSLLSGAGTVPDMGKMDLGELQMQYIRAWQQQQQVALAEAGHLPHMSGLQLPKSEGQETSLPSLTNGLLLPPPNPMLAFAGLGGAPQVLCPVPVAGLGMQMVNSAQLGTLPGVPLQMLVPAMMPTSLPLSS